MAESNDKQNQTATYLVTLQGLNEHITLDNLPAKFGLLCGGIGVKVLELERVDDQDDDQSAGFMLV